MLVDHIKHTLIRTVCTVKDFAFPVEDKFLQIECHGFCNTEILGILRDTDFHFFSSSEEMVDRMSTGKNNGRIKADFYFLPSEILRRNALQPDKRQKSHLHFVSPGQFKIWRLVRFRPGLGD